MNEILGSVKRVLGIENDDPSFDLDIMMLINTAFMVLNQLGVGPANTFAITGPSETWDMFTGTRTDIEGVKTYVTMKVRLGFDPPTSAFVLDSLKALIAEAEFRLNVQAENNPV